MDASVRLVPMTPELYHRFFREYENDPDLCLDPKEFREYRYEKETVDAYMQKQFRLKRLPFAIVHDGEIIGELKLYDIKPRESAWLGITLKCSQYKDRGFGTQAERLAVQYVFDTLDIPVLYADAIVTNTRSQHVLEKVGFQLTHCDGMRKYYRITKA